MNNIFSLPALGDPGTQGTVSTLSVAAGDSVAAEQTLIEVETDKVVIEIPAERAGKVVSLLVKPGDAVTEGQPFIELTVDVNAPPEKPPVTDTSEEAEAVAVVETAVIAATEESQEETAIAKPTATTTIQAMSMPVRSGSTPAGPAARKLARELGVDIAEVPGSGQNGRISKADVKVFVAGRLKHPASTTEQFLPLPDLGSYGPLERVALTGIQRATSANMSQCARRIPHAWLQEKVDITELEQLRQQHKDQVRSRGGSLTLTAILCKALAMAAKRHPVFNSAYDEQAEEIVYRQQVNVGVAVDTPRGLIVPVIEDLEAKSIFGISRDLQEMSARARDGKLSGADLKGGSITLSNLGGIGTSGIFPIINWPEVAILGVAASEWQPRYPGGDPGANPVPRMIMPVTLAFDHRVINGADGARFLATLKHLCENPFSLAIGD